MVPLVPKAVTILDSFSPLELLDSTKLLMSTHSGSPLDLCPVHVIKQIPDSIAAALTPLFNYILKVGQFPKNWKMASILPLLKKQNLDPKDPSNYRPISRLPLPAKMFEKTLNVQLSRFLQTNNILDPAQFGFRAEHSTELALIKSTEEIREALDQGGAAVLIMLDLSAAFDTVHHKVLMDWLSESGVQGPAWNLLKSFLTDRVQSVDLDKVRSRSFSLQCGVPQGSSLSPTLFNVYVSPFGALIRSFGFQLTSYVDDTQIVLSLQQGQEAETGRNCHNCMK